ncbi:MAG TPA: hypothetical protein VGL54_08400 [Solirubrobacteraceae bacterium]
MVATIALALVPACASAASPVLEFVVPGHSLPIPFATESGEVTAEMAGFASVVHCSASSGEGEITGPRSAVAEYRFMGCVTEKGSATECQSAGTGKEEIKTGSIDAELVYIDQAKHEVGILLDPNGGTYIAFECGGQPAEGLGPFLAPVGSVNTEATAFTATLSQSGSAQTPDEYETLTGERLPAIPMGKHGVSSLVTTGVEATFTVHPSWPGEIKAITAQEIEAQHEEEVKQLQATLKKQEEALKKAEEHAKQLEAANTQLAAVVKEAREEVAATKKTLEELRPKSQPPSRVRLLTKALRACEKRPKRQRARCVASARRKYGAKAENGNRRNGRNGFSSGTLVSPGGPSSWRSGRTTVKG